MKIGIIGAGAIGGTLARKYAENGHEVSIANSRGPDGVKELADSIGATATDAEGAVHGADVVILSIPFLALEKLPQGLFADSPESLTIIDTGNYYPGVRDPLVAEIDGGLPESVWTANRLGRPVIKAFNNIEAGSLAENGTTKGAANRIALPVAGDDAEHKKRVMALVEEAGFDAFDAGSLADSWRQQPNTPGYSTDYALADAKKANADAVKGVAEGKRSEFLAGIMEFGQKYPTVAARSAFFRTFNAV